MSESTDFFMFYFCLIDDIRRIGLYIRTLIYLKKGKEERKTVMKRIKKVLEMGQNSWRMGLETCFSNCLVLVFD